jgi:hypothetical protein
MAAGAVTSASAARDKAKGEQAALNYQAKVAENNRQIATWQSEDALQRGQTAINQHQLKVAQLRGTQRASLAARGIDLGQGSALDILSDTEVMGQIDANTIADNFAKEAWAYRNQASNAGGDAALLRGRADGISPGAAAAGSLLTSAGSVASSWYSLKGAGAGAASASSSKPYATGGFDFNTSKYG